MQTKARNKNPMRLAWAGLTLFVLVALAAVFAFTQEEKQRALLEWQDDLNLVADSRQDAVNQWLLQQFAVLSELTDNGSLQLYLAQLSLDEAENNGEELPEAVYLRDLLTLTAARAGYLRESATDTLQVNHDAGAKSGIALLDEKGRVIVTTPGMPVLNSRARTAVQQVLETGNPASVDLHLGDDNQISMGFAAPIHAIQGAPGDRPVGLAIGIKPVAGELFPLLRQKGLTSDTHETYLVRPQGGNVQYLSPLRDGTKPLSRQLKQDPERLAAAFALSQPGDFEHRPDYAGADVLFTSRQFDQVPWVLVQKISAAEALAAANSRQRTLLAVLLLGVIAVAVALVAAWKHGSSVRFREAAETMAENNAQLEAQRKLLRSVTDNVSDLIFILEPDMSFRFANAAISEACELAPDDFKGKSLSSVLGPHVAGEIEEGLSESDHDSFTYTDSLEVCEHARHFHINVSKLPDGAVLMVMRDVTDMIAAETRSRQMLYQLVQTLAGILDNHDPYTANHSRKVSMVSLTIAEQLGFSQQEIDALRIAASLMNLGKITIPKEVLTKTDKLTDEEFALIRGHISAAVNMLKDVEFEGPVVQSIA
ncbi:MAG: HD-GYP domain-containing protein, partial [Gammaproteobacteria bacterium]